MVYEENANHYLIYYVPRDIIFQVNNQNDDGRTLKI